MWFSAALFSGKRRVPPLPMRARLVHPIVRDSSASLAIHVDLGVVVHVDLGLAVHVDLGLLAPG
jgi:hypothetical protein